MCRRALEFLSPASYVSKIARFLTHNAPKLGGENADAWEIIGGRRLSAHQFGHQYRPRQGQRAAAREAIQAFAKRAGFALVGEFADPGVSGADPIAERPGFGKLLDRIEGNGVRVVIIEDASRFARELMTQELGILALMKRGVRVLTANGDDLTDEGDPSRKMMRQIAGAFAEYEKARLVGKLRAARNRVRAERGRCEGRKPVPAETMQQLAGLPVRAPKQVGGAVCVLSRQNWLRSGTSVPRASRIWLVRLHGCFARF
jgi:DNA invertase Pin-like site-specific DNA recombinase